MSSPDDNLPLSRQEFLARGVKSLLGGISKSLSQQWEQVEDVLNPPVTGRVFLRPPGAQPEAVFLALCTRCDACTAACPHEAISVHYGSGEPHDGTPVLLNLREHPCLLCADTPCIPACPTEALLPVADIRDIRIGRALIDNTVCSAYRGSGCRICYDVCPLKDEAILLEEGLPIVLDACTGCGICQHHCPESPEAIAVFPT